MTRHKLQNRALEVLRVGWPIVLLLAILWFPFDWFSSVWPTFGAIFRLFFRNEHDHFIGHTLIFLTTGTLILLYVPALRRRFFWYIAGLVLAALMQEAIQAFFAGRMPTFDDINAFKGDALGGISAFVAQWLILSVRERRSRVTIKAG
jgi:hypothetical protein